MKRECFKPLHHGLKSHGHVFLMERKSDFSLGHNIKGTSNYGTGKVLIGNMLSRLCS